MIQISIARNLLSTSCSHLLKTSVISVSRLESTKSGSKGEESSSGGACQKTAELAKKLRAKTPIGRSKKDSIINLFLQESSSFQNDVSNS